MVIDIRTPEGRRLEERNASLLSIRRHLQRAQDELEWLIGATRSGERRNKITEMNIQLDGAKAIADSLPTENLEDPS